LHFEALLVKVLPKQRIHSLVCTSTKLEKTRSTDAELAGLRRNAAIIVPCLVKTGQNLFLSGWFKPV